MGHGKILSIKARRAAQRETLQKFTISSHLHPMGMHEMMMLHSNIGAGFPGGALSSWHRVAMRF